MRRQFRSPALKSDPTGIRSAWRYAPWSVAQMTTTSLAFFQSPSGGGGPPRSAPPSAISIPPSADTPADDAAHSRREGSYSAVVSSADSERPIPERAAEEGNSVSVPTTGASSLRSMCTPGASGIINGGPMSS